MSKAFTKEPDSGDETGSLPAGVKNYMTRQGFATLEEELRKLQREERPKIVEIVSWAAGNGDRSENGDYLYGKKRLREIDRRIRYLLKRLDSAEVVDPKKQQNLERIFFGATVTYLRKDNSEHTVKLVGSDEADPSGGKISWVSPVARALMKAQAGDNVIVRAVGGEEELEVISVCYKLD